MDRGKVVIANNQVQAVETYVIWNGEPTTTIDVRRESDGTFRSLIGDPEHGGGSSRGTIDKVLEGLHPNISREYASLFHLTKADQASVQAAGFERYKIVIH
jgi:hypothetical protein